MGIELITGGIGAGKTCYAVAERIAKEHGREVAYEDQSGTSHLAHRRVIVAGVRGLVLDHERIPHTLTGEVLDQKKIEAWNKTDVNDEPVFKRLPGEPPITTECALHNWWMWAMPGDLIVCDEVQYIVPRGTLGRSPPHYIKALEVSRHYGVDFLFITQHPQLLDTTIRNLVTMHRHVRSVMGSSVCMVYVWDHASNVERITQAQKTFFKRKPEHFKLYKSTVAVVKQPQVGKSAVWVAPLLLVLGVFLGYRVLYAKAKPESSSVASAPALPAPPRGGASSPPSPVLIRHPEFASLPKVTGCYATASRCSCMAEDGRTVQVAEWMCRQSTKGYDGLVRWEPRAPLPNASTPPHGAAAGASGVLPGLGLPFTPGASPSS